MDKKHLDLSYEKCSFEVVSGELMISDPCYSEGTWCQGTVKARNGKWSPNVSVVDVDGWGHRVVELTACHEDFLQEESDRYLNDGKPAKWEVLRIEVGVDSGQAGIFDRKYFRDDKVAKDAYRLTEKDICGGDKEKGGEWYSLCCDRTLSFYSWGIIPYGVVSSSGYGDGGYVAEAVMRDGEAIAVKITFIPIEVRELEEVEGE